MQRIYYTDPSCRAFEAVVTHAVEHQGRPGVILDRTAFYPTSGGQPFDTGKLDSIDVVETVDDAAGIVHVLSAALRAGARVRGAIDWARRFDHMQQHTGQHVLSASFVRLFDNQTVGFHMGADASSIDLEREMSAAEVERAVDDANSVVWANRPVSIRFVSPAEAARLRLRKEPAREGTLRLIEIDGIDLSACGGTHVASTGSIGLVAAIASERLRGGSRVTFVCGGRALQMLRLYRDAVAGSVRELSVLPAELPAAIERLQAELKDQRKSINRQQEALAVHEARRLLDATAAGSTRRVVVEALDGWEATGLKAIASAMTTESAVAVALFSAGAPSFAVVARSSDVDVDAAVVLKRLIERFGGRGGGRRDLAQAGGLTGSLQEMCAAAREMLAG